MGLSEGDVFVFENVAYKISMIAPDDISDTVKIFTQQPTVDEVMENLEINGSIPLSVPQLGTASSFKLNAKVTDRRTSLKVATTFTCSVSDEELKPQQVEDGFSFGVECIAKSGDATITITSMETIIGDVVIDYKKGRYNFENKIGFDIKIDVNSTITADYIVEIDNDQDPISLFRGVAFLGLTPVTVSAEYFFLAGVTFGGDMTYTRYDTYSYKRICHFNFGDPLEETDDANSNNEVTANVSVGGHVGLRPMASIGILGADIVGLYVDAKVKENIMFSGALQQGTSEFVANFKIGFCIARWI